MAEKHACQKCGKEFQWREGNPQWDTNPTTNRRHLISESLVRVPARRALRPRA